MNWLTRFEFFAIGSAVFAALTALFGKIGVASVNSNWATFIRVVVILIFTMLVLTFRSQWQSPSTIDRRTWFFLVLSGLTTGLSWLCYYRALQLGPVSKVAALDKLSVALAIILGAVVLGEKLTLPGLIGAVMVVGGTVLIAFFG